MTGRSTEVISRRDRFPRHDCFCFSSLFRPPVWVFRYSQTTRAYQLPPSAAALLRRCSRVVVPKRHNISLSLRRTDARCAITSVRLVASALSVSSFGSRFDETFEEGNSRLVGVGADQTEISFEVASFSDASVILEFGRVVFACRRSKFIRAIRKNRVSAFASLCTCV